ncbi:auxilin-related protein 2-like [Pyrus ussuriensis x Pyrus communis]|uniref:Auxilin-related protein 2-like n=1 Tax=Pyrus ussuriensis x Pyrus communis TaxID=2448454 RepID=A0A5N5GTN6_9ROSA|nr:auxilin-related protein 2-like [Pyrus ussuriensis x Pyrus communis]
MNDFEGLLASDFGFKPSGKSAPMSASSANSSSKPSNFDLGSTGTSRSARASNSFSGSIADDRDSIFGSSKGQDFGDILGGSARYSGKLQSRGEDAAFNFDSMFGGSADSVPKSSSTNSGPVYDKPVYDDDIFVGVPGLKSTAAKVKYEDIFSSVTSPPSKGSSRTSGFDDILGGFGKAEPHLKSSGTRGSDKVEKGLPGFDDLLPGFGGGNAPSERSTSEASWPHETTANDVSKTNSNVMEDPFVVSGQYSDPLEEISRLSKSGSSKVDSPSVDTGRAFDDIDPFDGLGKSVPTSLSGRNYRGHDSVNLRADTSTNNSRASTGKESTEKPSVRSPDNQSQKKAPVGNHWDSHQTLFDMPTVSSDSHRSSGQNMYPPSYVNASPKETNVQVDRSPRSEENMDSLDNVWLTVSEIPLMTQPTSAPPPSRPPPPRPVQISKARMGSPASTNARKKATESSTQFFQAPKSAPAAARGLGDSPIDELEDFARGKNQTNISEHANGLAGEELEMNSVAAAMKEAMDKAEAKFRHAKEVRERGSTKAARSKEAQMERDEKVMQEKQERFDSEHLQREGEEEDMEQSRVEKEKEIERAWEEKEREQRRLEKERERTREMERERGMARQAVERATREARERAANEARMKAERAKAERAAVDKATAEARERAERAAVQRAQSEARERAAAEAKERAEKAAAEARERANAEAKEREAKERAAAARVGAEARTRAERAAVERAAAEARERAAAEARERAAAAARANQQRSDNDLEHFFSMGRASSAPRPRANSSDPFQNRQEPEVPKASTTTSSNIRKANSTTNIVDDLSAIFGAAPSSGGEFQDVEGETEERRRARLERHQRTQERTLKALAEKNERDLQAQREQAERHRIAETLDVEIKRWAAGKEGNLRALLSTMQYVLWPECGWQPVSLTDMITAASVKKVYRKATLCIHPDKVQQKGANLQQKYIAEKVFDLLKEAWNKFNSEELF